jgi:hypothetical protein
VYAFSRRGRARFDNFPDLMADDEFARLTMSPNERGTTKNSTFTIHPPRTVRGLIAIMTRARAAKSQFRARFPNLLQTDNTSKKRTLATIAKTPSLWLDAPVYLGLQGITWIKARRKLRSQRERVWERDDSSR